MKVELLHSLRFCSQEEEETRSVSIPPSPPFLVPSFSRPLIFILDFVQAC